MDRYARGPFNVGYERRLDVAALRQKRIAKAQDQRRKAGLDALLVWKDENQRYLTDLRPQLITGKTTALNGALLIEGRAPILFCSGGERDRVDLTMPWIEEAHTIPIIEEVALVDGMVKDILGPVLRKHGLADAKLGLDEANTVFVKALHRHFPKLAIEDGDTPMLMARRHKLPEEIVLLEEATAIADAVTASATAAIADGVRECEVAGEAMRTLFRLGGEYSHVMTPFVASGEHMAPPNRICGDKLIRSGDIVFIDIGAAFGGYFGDVARAVICGKPSDQQKRIFTAVYEGLMAGIAEMRPGRTNRDCTDAIVRAAGKHGLDGRFLSLFIAHGVGIGANEPPYIGETLPGAPTYEFEPGMVFAVEPLIWVPGVRGGGGVRLEDMVLITEGAPHVLSRAPYDERLMLG
ncbi:M24 family metallopeptidase [Rhodoplanes azumiensis]|uniref:M24 family metallopeptidase n=1 Tax=Rhodoplanes azumiensis TaxID=1897628 RepID=A0ABW5AF27_9BRAD